MSLLKDEKSVQLFTKLEITKTPLTHKTSYLKCLKTVSIVGRSFEIYEFDFKVNDVQLLTKSIGFILQINSTIHI